MDGLSPVPGHHGRATSLVGLVPPVVFDGVWATITAIALQVRISTLASHSVRPDECFQGDAGGSPNVEAVSIRATTSRTKAPNSRMSSKSASG